MCHRSPVQQPPITRARPIPSMLNTTAWPSSPNLPPNTPSSRHFLLPFCPFPRPPPQPWLLIPLSPEQRLSDRVCLMPASVCKSWRCLSGTAICCLAKLIAAPSPHYHWRAATTRSEWALATWGTVCPWWRLCVFLCVLWTIHTSWLSFSSRRI